jgi:SnoaL-like domain
MTDDPALPAPVAAAIDAANEHDLARFLACFTPDGVVDDWGREFRGPDAITGWSDGEFIGVGVILDVTAATTSGDRTTIEAQVGGDGFNGPSHFTFTVDGERVRRMEIRA